VEIHIVVVGPGETADGAVGMVDGVEEVCRRGRVIAA
jgi:hypothetical protein